MKCSSSNFVAFLGSLRRILRRFLLLGLAISATVANAELSPARRVSGVWETPFPTTVTLTMDDGFGTISVSQAKMKIRWTIRARGKHTLIASKPWGAISGFTIVDDGGGDPAIIAPIASNALQNLAVRNVFRDRVSSSRMIVTTLGGGTPVGRFAFTTDLLRGPYSYEPTPETLYTIPKLRFVRKR